MHFPGFGGTLPAALLASIVQLTCVPAIAAQSGWKKLDGQAVPAIFAGEVIAEEWLNTGGKAPTAATLKGKVWLLEFFATW